MSRPGREGRSAALRWAAAGVLALGLHAAAAVVLTRAARPEPPGAGGGDAIAVELEPVEGDTARADAAEPVQPADEATTASAPAADAAASQAAPPAQAPVPPPPDPAPPTPDPPPVSPPPDAPPVEAPPSSEAPPELAAAAAPAAEAPPDPPPPDQAPAEPRPEPPQPVAPPTPASQASAAAPEAEDASPVRRRLSAARETAWRGRLVPHLNRYRRFPPGLRSGTARIGFTVDRDGRVTSTAVVASSGDAALDAAARDLVERSSPFPAPPPEVTGAGLSFVVPVHYDARRP